MMNEKRILLRNVFSLFIIQVSNFVFPLITFPIIARIIGPEKFGIINYAAAVVGYFVLLINYGFDVTVTREVAKNKDNREVINKIFSNVLYAKLLLFAISLVAFIGVCVVMPGLWNEKAVTVYSFLICIGWVLTPSWLYQGMQDLNKFAVFNFIGKAVFTAIILLTLRTEKDYVIQPLIFSFSQILIGAISFFWALRLYHIQLCKWSIRGIMDVLAGGKSYFLSLVTINLYTYTSVIILGLFQNNTEVGYYSAANRLISIAQTVLFMPINHSLFPFIATAFGRDRDEGLEMIRKVLPVSLLFSFFYCFGILLFSPLIVTLTLGNAYQPSVLLLQILSFVPMIINLSVMMGVQGMMNLNMDKKFLQITIKGALLGLPLNLLMCKFFGSMGSAVTYITTEVFVCFLFALALKQASVNLFSRNYFRPNYMLRSIKGITYKRKAA